MLGWLRAHVPASSRLGEEEFHRTLPRLYLSIRHIIVSSSMIIIIIIIFSINVIIISYFRQ